MLLNFTKMQATGNDFVVIDNRQAIMDLETMIRITPKLCDRKLGIGADGTLFLCSSVDHDFEMVYRNADGSDAGMCGNGGRAISLYASLHGLGKKLRFGVHGTSYSSEVIGNRVSLHFDSLTCTPTTVVDNHETIVRVFTGTEHIVVPVGDDVHDDLEYIRSKGRELRFSALFAPVGTNVNFCTFHDQGSIRLSTYERGVEDRTLSCGTGSVAAAIVEHYLNKKNHQHDAYTSVVESPGGNLVVEFTFNPDNHYYDDIQLTGQVDMVFVGQIDG